MTCRDISHKKFRHSRTSQISELTFAQLALAPELGHTGGQTEMCKIENGKNCDKMQVVRIVRRLGRA